MRSSQNCRLCRWRTWLWQPRPEHWNSWSNQQVGVYCCVAVTDNLCTVTADGNKAITKTMSHLRASRCSCVGGTAAWPWWGGTCIGRWQRWCCAVCKDGRTGRHSLSFSFSFSNFEPEAMDQNMCWLFDCDHACNHVSAVVHVQVMMLC